MVDRQDLETRERDGCWDRGTLAMHCMAMSSGMLGIRSGGGWEVDGGGSEGLVEVSSAMDLWQWVLKCK